MFLYSWKKKEKIQDCALLALQNYKACMLQKNSEKPQSHICFY